jgi:hypothetical protein
MVFRANKSVQTMAVAVWHFGGFKGKRKSRGTELNAEEEGFGWDLEGTTKLEFAAEDDTIG